MTILKTIYFTSFLLLTSSLFGSIYEKNLLNSFESYKKKESSIIKKMNQSLEKEKNDFLKDMEATLKKMAVRGEIENYNKYLKIFIQIKESETIPKSLSQDKKIEEQELLFYFMLRSLFLNLDSTNFNESIYLLINVSKHNKMAIFSPAQVLQGC